MIKSLFPFLLWCLGLIKSLDPCSSSCTFTICIWGQNSNWSSSFQGLLHHIVIFMALLVFGECWYKECVTWQLYFDTTTCVIFCSFEFLFVKDVFLQSVFIDSRVYHMISKLWSVVGVLSVLQRSCLYMPSTHFLFLVDLLTSSAGMFRFLWLFLMPIHGA